MIVTDYQEKNVVQQSIFRYKLYKSVEDFAHTQAASKV